VVPRARIQVVTDDPDHAVDDLVAAWGASGERADVGAAAALVLVALPALELDRPLLTRLVPEPELEIAVPGPDEQPPPEGDPLNDKHLHWGSVPEQRLLR
jgi:hypothetical protein